MEKKIGIFYGSTMGNTESVANEIAAELGVSPDDVYNVSEADANAVSNYDILLLGSSTWGSGELQDDWYGFLEQLKGTGLNGKKVGLFGCGDATSYPDTFCDAVGVLYDDLSGTGCTFIGSYKPEGYPAHGSLIERGGEFVGLAIDESDESLTPERISGWVQLIEKELQ